MMRSIVERDDSVERRVNEAGPSNNQTLPKETRTSNFGGRAAASGYRSPDYGRARSRSRSPDYGRGRSRSTTLDYGRGRSRSRRLDYGRSRGRSRRLDYGRSRSRSRSLDYGRRRSRSRTLDYGRSRSRSRTLDYGRSRSRSRSLDYGRARSRSRSPGYAAIVGSPSRSADYDDNRRGYSDEPISGSGDSWNSETAEPGGNVRTPISGTLTVPELLDCPICYKPLASPVYQCTNGHVLCESCCTKRSNTCGTCSLPIGKENNNRCRAVEKILESFRIACKNAQHGCKTSLTYIEKRNHEKKCRYAPCYCPHLDCTFVGSPNCVYTHFASQHSIYSKKFCFGTNIYTSLVKDQKHFILQEEYERTVFVINHSIENYGSIVNVICIAPTSSKKQFRYLLTASDEVTNSKIQLESVAENSPQWTQQAPATKYVIVPNYCLTASGRLHLKLTIFEPDDW